MTKKYEKFIDILKNKKIIKIPIINNPLLNGKTSINAIKTKNKNKHAHGGTVYRGRKYNYGGRVAKWHK